MDQKQPGKMHAGIHTQRIVYPSYVQFPASNTKGGDIFPLVRQAIKHLIRLGLVVATVTCDGASDNRRMFTMFNAKSYKTENIFSADRRSVFFISDPPHLLKLLATALQEESFGSC